MRNNIAGKAAWTAGGDTAGERGFRISEVVFRRAGKQGAEVAAAKSRIRYRHRIRLQRVVAHEGLRIEEEHFAFGKDVRKIERAIDIASKLVEGEVSDIVCLERGGIARVVIVHEVVVANPRVGVQYGILKILVEAAMKLIAATLCDDANLAADGASILSRIVGGKNLNLLHGIEIRGAD